MRMLVSVAAAAVVVLSSACASGGRGSLSWNLGLSSAIDAQQKSVEVFRQRRYEIERTEGAPAITVITRWRDRLPFEDEREIGVTEARTRFILDARPRSRSQGADPNRDDPYAVRLRAENQGRLAGGSDFVPIETTPAFQAYADEIAEEIRTVLMMGIRTFQ